MARIAEVPECLTVLDAFDLPTVQDVGELPLIPFYRILKKVCGRAHFPVFAMRHVFLWLSIYNTKEGGGS